MSTLEKAIHLLQEMPERKIETVYAFIQFIDSQSNEEIFPSVPKNKNRLNSILGIAHEYANPALIEKEEGAFERAMAEKYAPDRR